MHHADPYEQEVAVCDSDAHVCSCLKLLAGAGVVVVLLGICFAILRSRALL